MHQTGWTALVVDLLLDRPGTATSAGGPPDVPPAATAGPSGGQEDVTGG